MKTSIMTGEMAKLHGISKETLRYYHQIGLLVPDTIDAKGYRHYSIAQFAHLDSILFLRDLGLSIQEIKDYFSQRNLDTILQLLKEKNEWIDTQLATLQHQQTAISSKVKLFEMYRHCQYEVCTLKLYPERFITRFPLQTYSGMADFEYGLKALSSTLPDQSLSLFKGMIGVSLSLSHIDTEHFGKWDHVVLLFDDAEHKSLDNLASGNYATITYIGSYEKSYPYYEQLLQWIDAHHFTPDGECLFLTISDTAFSNDPNEYINEIQIKIK
ncbi:MAG: MerR family transcriptional regulator [Cellulosilyticaceae bacterium]